MFLGYVLLLQAKVVDLDNLRVEVEKMRSNIQQLEGAKSWLERSLKETEVRVALWVDLLFGLIYSLVLFTLWFDLLF